MGLSTGEIIGRIISGMDSDKIDRMAREWKEECDRREGIDIKLVYLRRDFVEACVPREYS